MSGTQTVRVAASRGGVRRSHPVGARPADRWGLARDRSNWRDVVAERWRESATELTPVARRLGRGVLDGDDLLSEAFERLVRLWEDGRGPLAEVHGYLINSMRNRVIDERRSPRSATFGLPVGYDAPSRFGNPEYEIELDELRAALQHALDRLPPLSRELLIGSYLHGRKVSELAASLGITENAVSLRLSRAKRAMREMLLADPRVADRCA